MKKLSSLAIVSIAAVGALQAQQPQVQNAKVETRAVAGGLEATLRAIQSAQSTPVWVGYAVPIVPGDRQSCCWNNNSRGCFLEPNDYDRRVIGVAAQPVKLEGPTHLVVLYRFENRQVSDPYIYSGVRVGRRRPSLPLADRRKRSGEHSGFARHSKRYSGTNA